ncbi:MAG: hypothetical protein ACYDCO_23790 [Armatimonadota bacterium]
MNRWIVVLLLCVALYVGIILVKGFTTVVKQPDRLPPQAVQTPQNIMVQQSPQTAQPAQPALVVQQMSDNAGNTVVNLGLDFGNSPPSLRKEPTFEIRDANGKRIYQGRFEFG